MVVIPLGARIKQEKEVNEMPLGDRTGPLGQGPRTGRGWGVCPPGETAYPGTQPGLPRLGAGRGLGRGIGRGFGYGRGGGFGRGWRWKGFGRPW